MTHPESFKLTAHHNRQASFLIKSKIIPLIALTSQEAFNIVDYTDNKKIETQTFSRNWDFNLV